jgi:hypothetical protein
MVARTECPRGVFETSSLSSASMGDAGVASRRSAPCEAMLQPVDDEGPGRYCRRLFGCSQQVVGATKRVVERSCTADMENLLRRP